MKKSGFTLMEIIVVVASVGLIMTAVTGITLSIFKSQNRSQSTNKIVSNGNWILNELKKDVWNGSSSRITCIDNNSIGITSLDDGANTVISCSGNNIASKSGALVKNLNNISEVNIISCPQNNFVSCTTLPSLDVTNVNFNFGVGATTAGVGVTQYFSINVSIRN
jgi:prepilin-type N-terminal cleavage/methylation domain-containing protein